MNDSLNVGPWVALAQFVWLVGITVAIALRKPGEEASAAVSRLAKDVADIKAKGDLTDERVKHMPTHGDIRALLEDVAEMKGKIESVSDGQQRQQRVMERIEDWLNNQRRP